MNHLTIKSLNFDANLVSTRNELDHIYQTAIQSNAPSFFVAWNPEKIVNTSIRKNWNDIRQKSAANYADGIGVTMAIRLLTGQHVERIPGVDFFHRTLELLHLTKGKLFMFGAQPFVLEKAILNIQKKFPNIVIVGSQSGYDFDNQTVINAINATQPDVIAVALGSPKQEEWIFEHGLKANSGIFIGVGGTFSVWSGEAKRAPIFFRRLGLEWLYRLMSEPSRFKRQIVLPIFLWHLMKEKCRRCLH